MLVIYDAVRFAAVLIIAGLGIQYRQLSQIGNHDSAAVSALAALGMVTVWFTLTKLRDHSA